MLLSGLCDYPYCSFGFQRSQVGNNLAEVVVVGSFQLVFNDNGVSVLVFADKINAEVTSRFLTLGVDNINVQNVA